MLVALPAYADTADERFAALAALYIDEMPALFPVTATTLGDHRYDGELDLVSDKARREQLAFHMRYLKALEDIDIQELTRPSQVDAAMLRHALNYAVWRQRELEEWAWNPLPYTQLAGDAIYGLMARDYAPIEQRLVAATSRLRHSARLFRQVRASLDPARVPEVHARTAIRQHLGFMSSVESMVVPELGRLAGAEREELVAAIDTAREAAAEHQVWLEEKLLPKATGDFRLGRELYERKLYFMLNTPLDRLQIRERAENAYVEVRKAMYETAKAIYAEAYPLTVFSNRPGDGYRQAIIRAALELAYDKLPARDAVVATAEESLLATTKFVREKNLVRVPDTPLEIILMPEFRRGIALAYCDSPGALDKAQKTFYAVAPLPDQWDEHQVESFLREYNVYSIHELTIHEAMPGHYLQLAHANEYDSLLRAILSSKPFIEGWAVYAEKLMIDAGYYDADPLMRLIHLKWYLRAIVNAIIDQAIHVDGMSESAAMQLLIEGAFQEEREAAGKWVRAQLTSAQLATYFVGYQEHADLRATIQTARGEDFDLREYHDTVLSYGSAPVRFVRALMTDTPVPVDF